MLLVKNDRHKGFICHYLLLVCDASKLGTVYVVKSPVPGLQRAIFQENQDFFRSENFKKWF